jgi:hypothetical protein
MKRSESSSTDSDQLNKISEKETSKLTKELSRRKKAQDKKSIARSVPLKVSPSKKNTTDKRSFEDRWRTTAGNLSEEEQKKAVQQAIEVYSLLPASSLYAKHKLKVLNQALNLLEVGTERSQEEADQLQQLLQDLKL